MDEMDQVLDMFEDIAIYTHQYKVVVRVILKVRTMWTKANKFVAKNFDI